MYTSYTKRILEEPHPLSSVSGKIIPFMRIQVETKNMQMSTGGLVKLARLVTFTDAS